VKRKALSESEVDADLLHVTALLAAAPLPLFAVDLLLCSFELSFELLSALLIALLLTRDLLPIPQLAFLLLALLK
jgi:hypothetical protein